MANVSSKSVASLSIGFGFSTIKCTVLFGRWQHLEPQLHPGLGHLFAQLMGYRFMPRPP